MVSLRLQRLKSEPEKVTDEIAHKVVDLLGKTKPVQKIRSSQVLSAMVGVAGLALFLAGVEKVFAALSGWFSIIVGLLLLAISGALLRKSLF